jgi:hypothetical protein
MPQVLGRRPAGVLKAADDLALAIKDPHDDLRLLEVAFDLRVQQGITQSRERAGMDVLDARIVWVCVAADVALAPKP